MHCLEVIEHLNEQAAGREFAHAVNDGKIALAQRILDSGEPLSTTAAFYNAARAALDKEN